MRHSKLCGSWKASPLALAAGESVLLTRNWPSALSQLTHVLQQTNTQLRLGGVACSVLKALQALKAPSWGVEGT